MIRDSAAVKEERTSEVWENQRWYPVVGYSPKQLDRPAFSNRDGTGARDMNTLQPQPGWAWHSEWAIFYSQDFDAEGWQYALDFSSRFYNYNFTAACVRRRRWIRILRQAEPAPAPAAPSSLLFSSPRVSGLIQGSSTPPRDVGGVGGGVGTGPSTTTSLPTATTASASITTTTSSSASGTAATATAASAPSLSTAPNTSSSARSLVSSSMTPAPSLHSTSASTATSALPPPSLAQATASQASSYNMVIPPSAFVSAHSVASSTPSSFTPYVGTNANSGSIGAGGGGSDAAGRGALAGHRLTSISNNSSTSSFSLSNIGAGDGGAGAAAAGGAHFSRTSTLFSPLSQGHDVLDPITYSNLHVPRCFQGPHPWLVGALEAGAWMVEKRTGALYQGFTRGGSIRWARDPCIGAMKISHVSNHDNGAVWIIESGVPQVRIKSDGIDHEVYENERWKGKMWSRDNLTTSDRKPWTDKDGQVAQPLESIPLPSPSWQWRTNVQEVVTPTTDPLGYEYAVDFNGPFFARCMPSHQVRRRLLRRTRGMQPGLAWSPVPLPPDVDAAHITIGPRGVWVLSTTWQIFVRQGITPSLQEGLSWKTVDTPSVDVEFVGCGCITFVLNDGIWLSSLDGKLYFREGISATYPEGRTWRPLEAPRIRCMASAANFVFAIGEDGDLYVRLGLDAAHPNGASWRRIVRPPDAHLAQVSCSPSLSQIWVISTRAVMFTRSDASEEVPEGRGWVREEDMPHCASITVAACAPSGAIVLPALLPGAWTASILTKLRVRDQIERESARFAQFEQLYSHAAMVETKKKGLLDLRAADGTWQVYSFVLDDSTHSLCYYRTDALSGQVTPLETLHLQQFAGVAAIPLDSVYDEHEEEGGRDRLRLFQFRIDVTEGKSYSLAAESRLLRDEWIQSLLMGVHQSHDDHLSRCASWIPSADAMWAVDKDGYLWFCSEGGIGGIFLAWVQIAPPFRHPSWGQARVRFTSVDRSSDGVLWCTSAEGICYACTLDVPGSAAFDVTTSTPPSKAARASAGLDSHTSSGAPLSFSHVTFSPGPIAAAEDFKIPDEMFYSCIDAGEDPNLSASIAGLSPSRPVPPSSLDPGDDNSSSPLRRSVSDPDVASPFEPKTVKWVRVMPPLDAHGNAGMITSVAVVANYVWAVTSNGRVYVRDGVGRDRCDGTNWHSVSELSGFISIHHAAGSVWGVGEGNQLVLRCGFSERFPFGTHWLLSNGVVVKDVWKSICQLLDKSEELYLLEAFGEAKTAVLDVTGGDGLLAAVHIDNRVQLGHVAHGDIVKWHTAEAKGMQKVSCDELGKLWALSLDGDINRRDVKEVQTLLPLPRKDATGEEHRGGGVLQDILWNRMVCLSAHSLRTVKTPLKFVHFVASCSGTMPTPNKPGRVGMANGHSVAESVLLPFHEPLLAQMRVQVLAVAGCRPHRKWDEPVPQLGVGKHALVAAPDGFWYKCRVASFTPAVSPNDPLLVFRENMLLSDGIFMFKTATFYGWADRRRLVVDIVPHRQCVTAGAHVLFASPSGHGAQHPRFSLGMVDSPSEDPDKFNIRRVVDGTLVEIDLANLRFVPAIVFM